MKLRGVAVDECLSVKVHRTIAKNQIVTSVERVEKRGGSLEMMATGEERERVVRDSALLRL